MAFGQKAQDYKQTAKPGGDGDDQVKHFTYPWMPTGSGVRIFRILADVKNGEIVKTPRLSATGKELRAGNKKTGEILYGLEPAEETVFLSAWWKVIVNGSETSRRLMLNPNGSKARFNNPLWKYIDVHFPKKDGVSPQERNQIKLLFALNVYDMTPVMRNKDGVIFYPAEDGTWRLAATGSNNGKLIDSKDQKIALPEHWKDDEAVENGHAVPLNEVRIFEGSYGEPNGKHLFQQLADLVGTIENNDSIVVRLPEVTLRLTTKGESLKTNRSIRQTNDFKPLEDAVQFLPRYDLAKWTQAWPDEVINRLLEQEDFNLLVEEFELQTFPTLVDVNEAYTGDTEKLDPESVGLFD